MFRFCEEVSCAFEFPHVSINSRVKVLAKTSSELGFTVFCFWRFDCLVSAQKFEGAVCSWQITMRR